LTPLHERHLLHLPAEEGGGEGFGEVKDVHCSTYVHSPPSPSLLCDALGKNRETDTHSLRGKSQRTLTRTKDSNRPRLNRPSAPALPSHIQHSPLTTSIPSLLNPTQHKNIRQLRANNSSPLAYSSMYTLERDARRLPAAALLLSRGRPEMTSTA
jgi:hypothetical protein